MLPELKQIILKHWGYSSLRPLQAEAMRAVIEGRDSLVVMPTGGGKSLCYQAPAVLRGDTTVVISPLIALMKDQVDNLQAAGVPAIQIDSSQSPSERANYIQDIQQGAVRLLFMSPERLVGSTFHQLLRQINVRTFAIDEAHCISHWGHDFRPEYRQMRRIKEMFPGASVHAYTATATEQVRKDIAQQLALNNPEFLVGTFDRPNLSYRVLPRHDMQKQVLEVLNRHKGESGIIYCIRKVDVDELAETLRARGFKALPYHAGMSADVRLKTQETFAAEKCDIIVATVAFGMGIDRSNIRFVLHTGMPKSIEHYQQETGRAGRDGLEAECVLLHSGRDFMVWKSIVEKSAAEAGADPAFVAHAVGHLEDMDRYARGVVCRHKALSQYFGQTLDVETCAACDLCLGDTAPLEGALVMAQKILSCVARVKERFGIGHVISVLRGEDNDRIHKFQHEQLKTYGILKDVAKNDLRDWIYQLISQKVLVQNEVVLSSGGTLPILGLNELSWEVMRGQRQVRLLQLVRRKKGEKAKQSKADSVSWEGVDRELFESLRILRRDLAKGVPAYVVFEDRTLREFARLRPVSLEAMREIYGVGEARLKAYGEQFLERIRAYEGENAAEEKPTTQLLPSPPVLRGRGVGGEGDSQSPPPHPQPLSPGVPGERGAERTPPPAPPPPDAYAMPDSLVVAQKILSCVAKVQGRFHVGHIIRVLRGRDTVEIRKHGHDKLSTFGLLRDIDRDQIRDWIGQLAAQGFVVASGALNPLLELNADSWRVLRSQAAVSLMRAPTDAANEWAPKDTDWEGVDRELFEALEAHTENLADLGGLTTKEIFPPWVLLRMAQVRPSSLEQMLLISGMTRPKLAEYGPAFLQLIDEHSQARHLSRDNVQKKKTVKQRSETPKIKADRAYVYPLFRQGQTLDEVMAETTWSLGKVCGHLEEFIEDEQPASLEPWVPLEVQQRVQAAARQFGAELLKPIFLYLGENVPYEQIRLVLAGMRS